MKSKLKILFFSLISLSIFTACGMLPYKNDFTCEKGKGNGVCGSVTEVYDLSSDMEELRKQADASYEQTDEEKDKEAKLREIQMAKMQFKTQKLQEMVEAVEIRNILNETPTIFRYHLNEKDFASMSDVAFVDRNDKENQGLVKKDNKSNKNKPKKNTGNKSSNKKYYSGASLKKNTASKGSKDTSKNNLASKDLKNTNLDNNSSANQVASLPECAPSSGDKITQINGKVTVCVYNANIRSGASCRAKVLRIAKNGDKLDALYEQGGWIKLKDGTYVHKSIVIQD